MEQAFTETENTDPSQHQRWLDKHGFQPDEQGNFSIAAFEGKNAVEAEGLFENIRVNVQNNEYAPLYSMPYDPRTFVMICGGPSLERHLEDVKAKAAQPEKYLVVCSNMTGGWLLSKGIVPHAHFILDPQTKKKFDITPDKTNPTVQYWLNVACDPAVFAELKEQGIKPYAFLADFESDGKARKTVAESMLPGQEGMMAIQGGTMAGLRAINLADALGFRKMEYYGFDATVEVADGKARPYAYEKKRGEAIIEISCDRCDAKFDTTLIFQKQVNEFLAWRAMMPWMDIQIFGGGLIDHYTQHIIELEKQKVRATHRFTPEYAAIQKELHAAGGYGVTGRQYMPSIFHAISQLARKHGKVTVLDYGSSSGDTVKAVKEHFWLPPLEDYCYDPFVEAFAGEPVPADLVVCTDVMEHVEPECTWAVLDHIRDLTKRVVFFSISLEPARKVLSDGRNAHINLRPIEFWLNEIKKRFITSEVVVSKDKSTLLAVAQSIIDVADIIERGKQDGIKRAA